jgi:hypothetical protein
MSEGLDNLKLRLSYQGGSQQQGRMNVDKLRSLKRSLIYSYQAATAVLADGREFRCLINPDKLKNNYDDKIISIPFKDVRLNIEEDNKIKTTSQGEEEIGIKAGDVFTWKENNTYWIVYLQRLEETAYFRAEIRRCQYEIEVNGNKYKVWIAGPSKETVTWHSKNTTPKITWNDIDYDLEMYVTKTEDTEQFFHRFAKIEIDGKPYEVQAVDSISTEGIIEVALKEDFKNTIKKELIAEATKLEEDNIENSEEQDDTPRIIGNAIVYPYDEQHYEIKNTSDGTWKVTNEKIKILSQNSDAIDIMINTGRTGKFDLIYQQTSKEDIVLHITINSL